MPDVLTENIVFRRLAKTYMKNPIISIIKKIIVEVIENGEISVDPMTKEVKFKFKKEI